MSFAAHPALWTGAVTAAAFLAVLALSFPLAASHRRAEARRTCAGLGPWQPPPRYTAEQLGADDGQDDDDPGPDTTPGPFDTGLAIEEQQ